MYPKSRSCRRIQDLLDIKAAQLSKETTSEDTLPKLEDQWVTRFFPHEMCGLLTYILYCDVVR